MVLQKNYEDLWLVIDNDNAYNKDAADQATIDGHSYVYITGILVVNVIDSYPYAYILGIKSRSSDGEMEYSNVPLQANISYAIIVRAHTTEHYNTLFDVQDYLLFFQYANS